MRCRTAASAKSRQQTRMNSMWGNALGWTISGILLVLLAFGVAMINRASEISPPTEFGKDPAHLEVLEFTGVSPRAVVTMTETGDAGSIYRQAIADYQTHTDLYEA